MGSRLFFFFFLFYKFFCVYTFYQLFINIFRFKIKLNNFAIKKFETVPKIKPIADKNPQKINFARILAPVKKHTLSKKYLNNKIKKKL